MNTILQKRIKEAAFQESSMYNTIQEKNAAYSTGMKIASFALQNQWINVEEDLPIEKRIIAKISKEFCGQDDCYAILHRIAKEHIDLRHPDGYYDDYGENIPTSAITHWAEIPSLEGGEK